MTILKARTFKKSEVEKLLKKNRCCLEHLENGFFCQDALNQLIATRSYFPTTGQEISQFLHKITDELVMRRRPVDFNLSSGLTDEDYFMLTRVNQKDFESLLSHLKTGGMKESENRSLRNALGIYLLKMRLNVSQRVLAFLFGVSSQSSVSKTILAVATTLHKQFTPNFIGPHHISREQIKLHMLKSYSTLVNKGPEDLIFIADGTYHFVQKPSDHYLQRRSYSSHKHDNLFKSMQIVLPDGYNWVNEGLYFSDGRNNDPKILRNMWDKPNSIASVLQQGDCLILDRGFRDVESYIEEAGIEIHLPYFLKKGQKQFSVHEANFTRRVTRMRWVVESANARIKLKWRFFAERIAAPYFDKLKMFLDNGLAIINAFSGPLQVTEEFSKTVADIISINDDTENALQQKVEREGLDTKRTIWIEVAEDEFPEFPTLTDGDLKLVTLGVYQIAMGKLYNNFHLNSNSGYRFFAHKDHDGLIRVKMQSRFKSSQTYLIFIEFQEHHNGRAAIKNWYCKCETGARTLGCCSHVAAVLLYLGKDRFLLRTEKKNMAQYFLDAAEILAEEDEGEDEVEDEEENEVEDEV